jgi:hypothetical protein
VPHSRLVTFIRRILNITEYESEATLFMRDFLARHPEEIASQKKARRIWWDKDARERTAPPEAKSSPKSGGAEYTFRA